MRPHGTKCQQTLPTTTTTKELDPQEFFIDVALLIAESRLPDKNAGRGEGPHCPDVGRVSSLTKSSGLSSDSQSSSNHVCDVTNATCRQARQIVDEANNLWSRNIPTCLFVFLLPDQCSNAAQCLSDDAVLLERWTIQILPKRNTDSKLLPGQFLLQAVRSYLHFSQLSAWLIDSRGKSPTNVTYRIRMPGESGDCSKNLNAVNYTSSKIEKHQFPNCLLGKSLILNVSVESLARPFDLLTLNCRCLNVSGSSTTTTEEEASALTTTTTEKKIADVSVNVNVNQSNYDQTSTTTSNEIKDGNSAKISTTTTFVDECYSSPLTPATSTTDVEENETEKPATTLCFYSPISLPTTTSQKIRRRKNNENDDDNACCYSATNPLFDAAASSSDETSLKQRIDALRLEAKQLTTKWRRYADDYSTKNYAKQNQSTPSEVRFYVADDDEDEATASASLYRKSYDDDVQNASPSTSTSTTNSSRVVKCRKILFSGEDEMFHYHNHNCNNNNNEDVPSLIDFVVPQNSASVDVTVTSCERTNNNAAAGGAVKRKESLNERFARRQNESSLFARKWTKKQSSHNAAVLHFNHRTGLPLSSSPAPLKRNQNSFNFDSSLSSVTAIKSALYNNDHESGSSDSDSGLPLCKSAPASTNLLGNFEESALNGRIKPFGSVDGFTLELGASGAFCPSHVTLPVTTLFFTVSDDNAPSPYFGHCNLDSVGRKGYHTPKKGTVQATLFNPQGTVVKMFVVRYDLSDMPNGCQTFVRQRTFFMPSSATLDDALRNRSWLRYLIHLRFATSRSSKLYLHTDIRMLFSRKSELDAYNIEYAGLTTTNKTETYELRSFTEMPKNPKFSPRKLNGRQQQQQQDRDTNAINKEIHV